MTYITQLRIIGNISIGFPTAFDVVFDEAITAIELSAISVTGDAELATYVPSLPSDTIFLLLESDDVAPGSCTIVFAPNSVTPNLDSQQTFMVSWDVDGFPTITEITSAAFTLTAPETVYTGQTITIDIDADMVVNGLVLDDFSVDVGMLSNFQGSGDTYTVDLALPATGEDTAVVTLRENAVDEENDEVTLDIPYALVPVTLTPSTTDAVRGELVTIDVVFPTGVSGLVLSDFSATNGTFSNLQGEDGDTDWSVDLTMPATGDGTAVVTLPEGRVTPTNSLGTAATIDYGPARIELSVSDATPLTSQVVTVQISASHSITDLDFSDFSATDGELSDLRASGDNYLLTWTMPGTGTATATLTLREDSVPQGNAEVTVDVVFSPTRFSFVATPLVALTSQVVSVAISTDQDVTGLVLGDFSVTGGNLISLSGQDDSYILLWQMPSTGSGTVTLNLPADSVNEGNAVGSLDVTYGPTTATITPASMTGVVRSTIELTIGFNQDVTGLALPNFSASNGGTFSNLQGSGDEWTVDFRLPPSNVDGSTEITLEADAVNEGNSPATVTVNFTTLTVAVTFDESSGFWSQEIGVNLVFSSDATGLVDADVTSDVGVISNVQGSGRNWTATLTLPNTGTGDAEVTVAAGAADEGNSEGSGSIAYAAITATITPSVDQALIDTNFTFNVQFVTDVTGIDADDFSVDNGTVVGVTGSGDYWEVEVLAPDAGEGTITITMRTNAAAENSVIATGSTMWVLEDPAAPVIDMVEEQFIAVNQEYRLRVRITAIGGVNDAFADGDLDGYSTHWDAVADEIIIQGTPDSLTSGKRYTIHARSGTLEREREVIYNVVPAAPIIEDFGTLTAVKGRYFEHQIDIENNPSTVIVRTVWVGLKKSLNEFGVLIFGDVPEDQDFTIAMRRLLVIAGNQSGEHQRLGTLVVSDYGTPTQPTEFELTSTLTSITANWEAPMDDGGQDIDGYRIRLIEDGTAGNWINKGPNATSHTFSGLTLATEYMVELQAENSQGFSPAVIETIETSAATRPDAPPNLATTQDVNSITVTWDAATANGADITMYRIRSNNGGWTQLSATTLTYTFSGLGPNSEQNIEVQARNSQGWSDSSSITVRTDADTPGPATITISDVEQNSFTAEWDQPTYTGGLQITMYRIRINSGNWIELSATTFSRDFTGLNSYTFYTVELQARNTEGWGAISAAELRTDQPPHTVPIGRPGTIQLYSAAVRPVALYSQMVSSSHEPGELYSFGPTNFACGPSSFTTYWCWWQLANDGLELWWTSDEAGFNEIVPNPGWYHTFNIVISTNAGSTGTLSVRVEWT